MNNTDKAWAWVHAQQALQETQRVQVLFVADRPLKQLNSLEIEALVDSTRALLQAAIVEVRNAWGLDGQPVIRNLMATANLLRRLGQSLLAQRPPIISATIEEDFLPLALLASRYNQTTEEVLRLNPTIQNLNFLVQGQTVRVYAL